MKAAYPNWCVRWAKEGEELDAMNVFVGGLHPFQVTQQWLFETFSKYGYLRMSDVVFVNSYAIHEGLFFIYF